MSLLDAHQGPLIEEPQDARPLGLRTVVPGVDQPPGIPGRNLPNGQTSGALAGRHHISDREPFT
eukprot:2583972-Alexandrium_andersonii.AAC.1